ncbi:hypothetical protein [Streptomyces blastmyceticus]|uniref:Uncharacterized protein n=1 Tax=Streptomyces blastmyceticus TaxID=68180 RepID=A0ABP3GGY3_9ACTN
MVIVMIRESDAEHTMRALKRKFKQGNLRKNKVNFEDGRRKHTKYRATRQGIVIKIEALYAMENGEPRHIAKVKLCNGDALPAYIPSGVKGVTEGASVWVRASRSIKVPDIHHRVKPASTINHGRMYKAAWTEKIPGWDA